MSGSHRMAKVLQMKKYFDWYGKPIILASKSPRRSEILKLINIDIKIHSSDFHEKNTKNTTPTQLVIDHAYNKASIVAPFYKNSWIIGADTIVVKGNTILGKPKDKSDAIKMLHTLSGVTHSVYTGYCIINSSNKRYLKNCVRTDVTFMKLLDEMIEYYVANFNPYDKAGSYAIQDFSAVFVKEIKGCFYNVVGFPLPAFYSHILKELHTCI